MIHKCDHLHVPRPRGVDTLPRMIISARHLAVAAVLVGGLSACSSDGGGEPVASAAPTSTTSATTTATTTSASATTGSEGEPAVVRCDQVAAQVQAITTGLRFSAADSSELPDQTSCVWTTPETDGAAYGTLSVSVGAPDWYPEDLADLDGAQDDPRAAAVGGRVLPAAPGTTMAEMGQLQLVYPGGTVSVVVTGSLYATPPSVEIPADDAIGAAAGAATLRS